MHQLPSSDSAHLALVSRPVREADSACQYLVITPSGRWDWTTDAEVATTFASMREAARAALRLPGSVRAFGLPRDTELMLRGQLN